jgi:hypothetical protein
MTAAYRLKGLGWFASCTAIVLGFYLVSLQVAAERNRLEALNGRIRSAERDIRALETEFDTRANLAQLERWNGDILALSAPTAGQFVGSEAQLAAVSFQPLGGEAGMRTAALVVPAAAPAVTVAVAPPPPAPVQPVAVAQAVVAAAKPKPAAKPVAPVAPVAPARLVEVAKAVVKAARAQPGKMGPERVAMLDRELLSDQTFGAILSGARAEARKR